MKSGRAYGHTDSNLINARNERYDDSSDIVYAYAV